MRGSWKDGAGSADATFLRPPHILRLIGLMPDRRYAMDLERRTRLYDRVDRASELPMLVLAAAMLPLILIPLLIDLSAGAEAAFWTANWLIWAAFAAELGLKTYLAPSRRQYLVQHWFDVLIVVIPFLRPLRIVQSARALRLLRLVRLLALFSRLGFTWKQVAGRRGLGYVLALGLVAVFVIAGLEVLVERSGPAASIGDFPTALWWATATVTTVGYGDTTPITAAGRGLGVLLMFVGIGVFGVFTANVAAFFVEEDEQAAARAARASTADDGALLAEISSLRDEMAELRRALGAGQASR